MSKAYGSTTWWGFSPAQDLLDVLKRHEVECNKDSDVNILLVGSGDGRHILKTISKLRNSKKIVNFYVIENDLEALARQLLMINLAMESSNEYGLQEKAELFLELYGNSLIRDVTYDYLCRKSDEFIKLITDSEHLKSSIWDFSNLKFKERDQLEGIFNFWRNKDGGIFNIRQHWDYRLRDLLGVRYDTRENSYDWDHSMKLKSRALIIGWHEYKHWREYGVAFKLRDDSAYETANRTLTSGVIINKDGEAVKRRGYWGDIMNGPYITYGIESHEKSLFKTNNNSHLKTSTDVVLYNITSIIHELNHGSPYSTEEENKISEINEESSVNEEKKCENDIMSNIHIYFLPLACVSDLHRKSKYKNRFDLISFSNSMVHFLVDSVGMLFSPNAMLMIESTKFMLDLKDELHEEYGKKIKSMAETAGCVEMKTFRPVDDSFAVYKFSGL